MNDQGGKRQSGEINLQAITLEQQAASLLQQGLPDQAEELYARLMREHGGYVSGRGAYWSNRSVALLRCGMVVDAAECALRAVGLMGGGGGVGGGAGGGAVNNFLAAVNHASYPAEKLSGPGGVLLKGAGVMVKCGQYNVAIGLLQRLLKMEPKHVGAWINVSAVLQLEGKYAMAEQAASYGLNCAAAGSDEQARLLTNRALARMRQRKLEGAQADALAAVSRPNAHGASLHAYGQVLMELGRGEDAMRAYELAAAAEPVNVEILASRAYALMFQPGVSEGQIAEAHKAVGKLHEQRLGIRQEGREAPSGGRQIGKTGCKVGYVSSHLNDHPVSRFLLPILEAHRRLGHDVTVFSDTYPADAMTERLGMIGLGWQETWAMDDAALAEVIGKAGIDVLVDIDGAQGRVRYGAYARLSNDVRVYNYLGYPATTGMGLYRAKLTHMLINPAGANGGDEQFYTEPLVRVPGQPFVYDEASFPTISPQQPLDVNGYLTLGLVNQAGKLSAPFLACLVAVMRAVPGAKLLALVGHSKMLTDRLLQVLEEGGIGADRLIPAARGSWDEYVGHLKKLDIALDTFPFAGHTTTFDCMAMGVPVVSMGGETVASRLAWPVFHGLGMREFVTKTQEDYVRMVGVLAGDLTRLRHLRTSLRARMKQAGCFDGTALAQWIVKM